PRRLGAVRRAPDPSPPPRSPVAAALSGSRGSASPKSCPPPARNPPRPSPPAPGPRAGTREQPPYRQSAAPPAHHKPPQAPAAPGTTRGSVATQRQPSTPGRPEATHQTPGRSKKGLPRRPTPGPGRSEEHTSELQSRENLV